MRYLIMLSYPTCRCWDCRRGKMQLVWLIERWER